MIGFYNSPNREPVKACRVYGFGGLGVIGFRETLRFRDWGLRVRDFLGLV